MNEKLQLVLNSLNAIEVHGKENLDMLLGCIQVIEQIIIQNNPQIAEQESEVSVDGR